MEEILIMMSGLFLLFVITMVLALYGKRQISIALFFLTLILCVLLFWHHVTEPLNLNF